jgi:hypothetical protein
MVSSAAHVAIQSFHPMIASERFERVGRSPFVVLADCPQEPSKLLSAVDLAHVELPND